MNLDAIPEEYRKPFLELGRILGTLAAFALIMKLLGVATKDDVHAMDLRLTQVRARVDVIGVVVQTETGVVIFWELLEKTERGLAEVPVGPVLNP